MTINCHIGAGGPDLTGNRDLHDLQQCRPDRTPGTRTCGRKQTVLKILMEDDGISGHFLGPCINTRPSLSTADWCYCSKHIICGYQQC